MPVLLGGLLKATGMKANVDVPNKAKYMIKDCKLWAEKKKIKFKFNDFFPISKKENNLELYAETCEKILISSKHHYLKLIPNAWKLIENRINNNE